VSLPGMGPSSSSGSLKVMKMVSNGKIVMKTGHLLILWGIQDSVAGVLTRLWTGLIGVQFPGGQDIFSPFQIVQTGSRVHLASYSLGTWFLGW
jgi:hypothetical protein